MKAIVIRPEHTLIQPILHQPHAWIRFRSPGADRHVPTHKCLQGVPYLEVRCHDITIAQGQQLSADGEIEKALQIFNYAQAIAVANFICRHQYAEHWLVNCEAGISRSAAAAAAIAAHVRFSQAWRIWQQPFHPNPTIYRQIMKALGYSDLDAALLKGTSSQNPHLN